MDWATERRRDGQDESLGSKGRESQNKSVTLQALGKELGLRRGWAWKKPRGRTGLTHSCRGPSFTRRAPVYSETGKQLGFLIRQFFVVNMDPFQTDLPGL